MNKYINADDLAEKYLNEENCYPTDDYFEGYADGIIFSHHLLDEMPSADVVEVVRCKDCIHWLKDNKPSNKPEYRLCEYYRGYKNQDGYCDFGERKETE